MTIGGGSRVSIRAIDLTPDNIGRVIRFIGKRGDLTYKTRVRLDHYITYGDCMELGNSIDERYLVGFETEIEMEEQ